MVRLPAPPMFKVAWAEAVAARRAMHATATVERITNLMTAPFPFSSGGFRRVRPRVGATGRGGVESGRSAFFQPPGGREIAALGRGPQGRYRFRTEHHRTGRLYWILTPIHNATFHFADPKVKPAMNRSRNRL